MTSVSRDFSFLDLINLFDIGSWLKSGINTLEIEVATTLMNQLRVSDPGVATRQAFGLGRPVMILPYREAVIAS